MYLKFEELGNYQISILILGLVLIISSVSLFQLKKDKTLAIALLILGGLSIRIFMAMLDPFLNIWDEQYHALVAKNMIQHLLTPTLYENPILPYDYTHWAKNHIWLHKQPLFLWQMAISMKIFGVNTFAMRLPSIIMSTLMILIIYRIGKLTVNKNTAFYAALLFALSNFSLEMVSGYRNVDHNDVAFIFYITASFWAWTEYINSGKRFWIIFIGLFSGCAVLVKWLVGILVYSGWGLVILFNKERKKNLNQYIDIIISFIITLLVFLPWQIYILNNFPIESRYEFSFNISHLLIPIENHDGNAWYHFLIMKLIYGKMIMILSILAITVFIIKLKKKEYKIGFLCFIILVYAFYAFAATKMPAYTLVICSLIYLAVGALLDYIFSLLQKVKVKPLIYSIFVIIALLLISHYNFKYNDIYKQHTIGDISKWDYRSIRVRDTKIFKSLPEILPSDDYIIFNCREFEHVLIMFHTDYIAYSRNLNYDNYKYLKEKGYKMAVFDDNKLPDFITNDKAIFIIKSEMW